MLVPWTGGRAVRNGGTGLTYFKGKPTGLTNRLNSRDKGIGRRLTPSHPARVAHGATSRDVEDWGGKLWGGPLKPLGTKLGVRFACF